ncbi:MAG: oxidoreductase, partial [Halomonadaceae bacterium]
MSTTTAAQLWFTAPFEVEVRHAPLPEPGPDEVLVNTLYSAISAGTELLLYRGHLPQAMALDSTLDSLQQSSQYPVQFGYACVGEVAQIGSNVDPAWRGKTVFSFQPHASHFTARPDQLMAVPEDIPPQSAVFLPNVETAVNLVQDGQPLIGERVVVLGQGVVGLLLSGVLAQHPLGLLSAVEGQPQRQRLARQMGIQSLCSPAEATLPHQRPPTLADADLIYEVSGHPDALNLAISLSGYCSRIVIGSWY